MRFVIVFVIFCCLPLFTHASGSWSATRAGVQLHAGGQEAHSVAFMPPRSLPAGSQVTQLSWRIQLLSAAPRHFHSKLCNAQRCIELEGLQGMIRPDGVFLAQGPFHFVYHVASRGALLPSVYVVSNQLSVNYR